MPANRRVQIPLSKVEIKMGRMVYRIELTNEELERVSNNPKLMDECPRPN